MDNHTNTTLLGTDQTPAYSISPDDKTLAILSHVLALPASFLAPLIIYIIKKDDSPFVSHHAKESLNFQITLIILSFICGIFIIVLIGIFLLWILGIADLILIIIATIRASEGKLYWYPFNFRLIK